MTLSGPGRYLSRMLNRGVSPATLFTLQHSRSWTSSDLAEKVQKIPHSKVYGPSFMTSKGLFRPFDLRRLKAKFPYITDDSAGEVLELLTSEAAQNSSTLSGCDGYLQDSISNMAPATRKPFGAPTPRPGAPNDGDSGVSNCLARA